MKSIAKLVGLVIGCVLLSAVLFQMYALDGIAGALFSPWCREDTVYSPGYSDSAFRRVESGMTRTEVLEILGEPFEERTDAYATRSRTDVVCWAFTHTPGNTNYRLRLVCFDSSGLVAWKHSEFWLD